MTLYTTYVGRFKETSEANKVLKKLNEIGYKGFLFSMNDYYTLKVYTGLKSDMANGIMADLKRRGYDSFIVESSIKLPH